MNLSTEQLLFILWGVLSTIQIFIGILQSISISSGISQIDPEMFEHETDHHGYIKEPGVVNGVFGIEKMPSDILLTSIFAPLLLCRIIFIKIIKIVQYGLNNLDNPTPKKNKLIEDAEKDKLDLKEFVKKKQKLK